MRVCPTCRSVYAAPVPWCRLDGTPLVEREDDPLVGHQLDRYLIEAHIGSGGMGRVYRARHSTLNRSYALKVLYGDLAGEPKFAERFRREAMSMSRVRHVNVVQVEDFGRTPEGVVFLVLELVEGRTLEKLLDHERRLQPLVAADYLEQLLKGLAAVHATGLVHRDVKPQNMLISPQGVLKLVDFGTVRLLERDAGPLTSVGHLVGTPAYMAPEQASDSRVAPSADLYSAGVVLFEMLTGRIPFDGSTRAEVLIKQATVAPPPAPLSEGLEELVALLLEKRPEHRPQTAGDVLRHLGQLEAGERLIQSSASTGDPFDDETHFDPVPAALKDEADQPSSPWSSTPDLPAQTRAEAPAPSRAETFAAPAALSGPSPAPAESPTMLAIPPSRGSAERSVSLRLDAPPPAGRYPQPRTMAPPPAPAGGLAADVPRPRTARVQTQDPQGAGGALRVWAAVLVILAICVTGAAVWVASSP